MASSNPQFPFNDENNAFGEKIQNDRLSDFTMDNAMKFIFASCDTEKTGSVQVSKLIDFINPFMSNNETELVELKRTLDPNDIDPFVNETTFFNVITEWASKIEETRAKFGDTDNCQGSKINEMDQFTVEESVNSDEAKIADVSLASCCSDDRQSRADVPHWDLLQERINELEHQNRKVTEELDHAKALLVSSEEQNEQLKGDLSSLARKLKSEQKLNKQLQKNREVEDEVVQSSNTIQQEIHRLQKLLASSEEQIEQLQLNVENLQHEKSELEENILQLEKQKADASDVVLELQMEINSKDKEISSLEGINISLKSKLDEQHEISKHYMGLHERTSFEKKKLEKFVGDRLVQNLKPSSPVPLNEIPGTFQYSSLTQNDNSASFAKIASEIKTFNSPKLLSMLKYPVSPHILRSSTCTTRKKSIDSNDSPKFSFPLSPLDPTSTPKGPAKLLIDQTSPTCVRSVPVLLPTAVSRTLEKGPNTSFGNYRLLGTDDNSLLLECAQRLYGPLSPRVPTETVATANAINAIEGNNRNLFAEQGSSEGSVPANTSFDVSNTSDMFCKLQMMNFSAHESLESEISKALQDNQSTNKDAYVTLDKKECEIRIRNLLKVIENLKDEDCIDSGLQQELNIMNSLESYIKVKEINELEEKCKDFEDENNNKQIKIAELTSIIENLRGSLKSSEDTIENLRKEMKQMMSDKNDIVKHLSSCRAENSNLQAENEKLSEIVNTNATEFKNINVLYSNLTEELKEKEQQIVSLKNKSRLRNFQMEGKENKIRQFNNELQSAKQEMKRLQQKVIEVEDEKNKQIMVLRQEKEKLLNEIGSMKLLKDEKTIKKDTFDILQIKLEKLRTRSEVIEQELESKRFKIRALESNKIELQTKISNISGILDKTNDEKRDAIQRKDVALQECTKLKLELQKNSEINIQLEIKLQGLQAQLKSCEDELVIFKIKLSGCSNDLYLLSEYVLVIKNNLIENKEKLKFSTSALFDKWRAALGNVLDSTSLRQIEYSEATIQTNNIDGPLDEELSKLYHQIHVTISLCDALGTLKIPTNSCRNVEIQVNLSPPKPIKKYTDNSTSTYIQENPTENLTVIKNRGSRTAKTCQWCTTFIVVGFIAVFCSMFANSWQWHSFHDFINKHIKLAYPNGPPPI